MVGSTKEFRKAQRYYGENLCGFSHPEYDYKKFVIYHLHLDEQHSSDAAQILYQIINAFTLAYEKTGAG